MVGALLWVWHPLHSATYAVRAIAPMVSRRRLCPLLPRGKHQRRRQTISSVVGLSVRFAVSFSSHG